MKKLDPNGHGYVVMEDFRRYFLDEWHGGMKKFQQEDFEDAITEFMTVANKHREVRLPHPESGPVPESEVDSELRARLERLEMESDRALTEIKKISRSKSPARGESRSRSRSRSDVRETSSPRIVEATPPQPNNPDPDQDQDQGTQGLLGAIIETTVGYIYGQTNQDQDQDQDQDLVNSKKRTSRSQSPVSTPRGVSLLEQQVTDPNPNPKPNPNPNPNPNCRLKNNTRSGEPLEAIHLEIPTQNSQEHPKKARPAL